MKPYEFMRFYHPKLGRFVYVIGLHAVKKFLGLPNWTRPTASSNLAVLGIFLIQLFPNWTSMLSYYLLIIEHPKTEKHGKYFTSLRFARHATGQTL